MSAKALKEYLTLCKRYEVQPTVDGLNSFAKYYYKDDLDIHGDEVYNIRTGETICNISEITDEQTFNLLR